MGREARVGAPTRAPYRFRRFRRFRGFHRFAVGCGAVVVVVEFWESWEPGVSSLAAVHHRLHLRDARVEGVQVGGLSENGGVPDGD